MNNYLRNLSEKEIQNNVIDRNILDMWNIIRTAPAFDKSYIVYRFIQDDSFLSHLNVNDIFIDPGFVSTTRDPFYRSSVYKFGFILIKIKLPENMMGIGLSVESFSHFPKEEEIILPPYSKLKLVSKNLDCAYYHIDSAFQKNVVRRYEFEYIKPEKEIKIKGNFSNKLSFSKPVNNVNIPRSFNTRKN